MKKSASSFLENKEETKKIEKNYNSLKYEKNFKNSNQKKEKFMKEEFKIESYSIYSDDQSNAYILIIKIIEDFQSPIELRLKKEEKHYKFLVLIDEYSHYLTENNILILQNRCNIILFILEETDLETSFNYLNTFQLIDFIYQPKILCLYSRSNSKEINEIFILLIGGKNILNDYNQIISVYKYEKKNCKFINFIYPKINLLSTICFNYNGYLILIGEKIGLSNSIDAEIFFENEFFIDFNKINSENFKINIKSQNFSIKNSFIYNTRYILLENDENIYYIRKINFKEKEINLKILNSKFVKKKMINFKLMITFVFENCLFYSKNLEEAKSNNFKKIILK